MLKYAICSAETDSGDNSGLYQDTQGVRAQNLWRVLYSILVGSSLPFMLFRLWWKSRLNPNYRARIGERLGFCSLRRPGGVWIHGVSVGESVVALSLARALHARYPNVAITLSCTTPTGSARIESAKLAYIEHCYLPFDLKFCLNRFLKRRRPQVAIILETELWPNLWATCQNKNIPIVMANARLSPRSRARYQWIASLIQEMLQQCVYIGAQSSRDASYFKQLGAPSQRIHAIGNLKFDHQVSETAVDAGLNLRASLHGVPIWIAASTHEGEESILLSAHRMIRAVLPKAILILVPRHPERASRLLPLIAHYGWQASRRSLQHIEKDTVILLGDTFGELEIFYAAAQVAFIGGSLVPIGGHNYLEAALLKRPCLSGPYTFNFVEIAKLLEDVGGLKRVHDAASIAEQVLHLLQDEKACLSRGEAAFMSVAPHRGATKALLNELEHLIDSR